MRTRSLSWSVFVLTAVAGCATTHHGYAPVGPTTWADGYPATTVAVPPEAPQGRVELSSFGVVEITPDGAGAVEALHVRMVVVNDGDPTPWLVAGSDQLVEIPREGRSAPIYVNTDAQPMPGFPVAQRDRRVLDLYYPMPAGLDADDLRGFELLWTVTTGSRPYASRTRFVQVEERPPQGEVVLYSGWGPYWWYDPLYPRAVFVHHRVHRFIHHPPPRVIVSRPPRWHRQAIRDHRRR